jgi:dihydrofolate reductase
MRRLTINTFLTLDGVMQAPGGPEEDPTGGFTHGGWSANYWGDEAMGREMSAWMGKPSELLLGRKTYEIFAAYWPHSTDEQTASQLNSATKYVASRTLETVEWENSTLLRGDAAKAVAELKRKAGPEIQVHGSANLIQTLLKHDLIDEFRLWMFPVVLGTGKRLFAEGTVPTAFKVVRTNAFTTGVTLSILERAGAVQYGTIGDEEPTAQELERRSHLVER